MLYPLLVLLLFLPRLALAAGPASWATGFDTLPNLGANPTVQTVKDGDWNDRSVWSAEALPGPDDIVSVIHKVVYDTIDVKDLDIGPGGVLTCRDGVAIHLTVETGMVSPGGNATCRTTHPVDIVIRAVKPSDPGQYRVGLLAYNGGLIFQGAPKTAGAVRLAKEALRGETTLTLSFTPQGWNVGDTLVLHDTRQVTEVEQATFVGQWEEVTIARVDGAVVTLTKPLVFAHLAAYDREQQRLAAWPVVANMTRSIRIRSADPNKPGHIFCTMRADCRFDHVEIYGMGRTLNQPLHSTTNPAGRYPLHLHHLYGPATPHPSGYQFAVTNSVIWRQGQHRFKWALAVHDSHYGLVQNNVLYNAAGALLATEEGGETGNLIDGNVAIRVWGSDNRGDGLPEWGSCHSGDAFCFYGVMNKVTRNFAANVLRSGPSNGFCYKHMQSYRGNVRRPNARGNDTITPGQWTQTDPYAQPFGAFEDNECQSAYAGYTYWWIGSEWQSPRNVTMLVKNLRLYKVGLGIYPYESAGVVIDGLECLAEGDPARQSGWGTCYLGGDYFIYGSSIKNSRISGYRIGIQEPTLLRAWMHGPTNFQVSNSSVTGNVVDLMMRTIYASAHTAEYLQDVQIVVTDSDIRRVAWDYRPQPVSNLVQLNSLKFVNYRKQPGDTFQLYAPFQAPDTKMPAMVVQGASQHIVSCPGYVIGPGQPVDPAKQLTNAQCMQGRPALALFGAIAPCTDTRQGLDGFACGVKPPVPTPIAPPAAPRGLNVTFN